MDINTSLQAVLDRLDDLRRERQALRVLVRYLRARGASNVAPSPRLGPDDDFEHIAPIIDRVMKEAAKKRAEREGDDE